MYQQRRLLEPGRVYVLGMATRGVPRCEASEGVALVACGRVASGAWLEVTTEACTSGIPTKIRICCELRLKCVHVHVARRPRRATTCASRRSEISFRQHMRNSFGVSAKRALQAAAPPLRMLQVTVCPKRRARARPAQSLLRQHAAVRVSKLSSPTAAPRSARFAPRHRPFLALQTTAVTPRPADGGAAQVLPARKPEKWRRGTPVFPLHGLAEGVRHVHPQKDHCDDLVFHIW